MSGLRICCFADTFLPLVGGAETVLHRLASHLTERGVEIVVLAPRVRGRDNRLEVPYRVARYAKPSSKRFAVRQTLIHLAWLHARYRFDLIHCHAAYPPAYVATSFRRIFGVPFVVRPHGSDVLPGERIRRHARLERRVRRSLGAADAVIAQGAFLAGVLRELGVDDRRIRTIHNGVELEEFRRAPEFEHPRPYLFAIGNMSRRKGFDVLLEAWGRVDPRGVDLLLAGDGPERPALEALAAKLGLTGRTTFLGHVSGEHKASLYRGALFLVCPSRSEPFANVILEGLASGLPIVASAVGGNTELVRDGEHGLLFPSEDASALAERLRALLADPELLARLRAAVPDFAARFDWKHVAGEYVALYEEVVAARQ